MATPAYAEYLRTLAQYLEKDLKAKEPMRRDGAIARLKRAKPVFNQQSEQEILQNFRFKDAQDAVAIEQGFSNWQAMVEGSGSKPETCPGEFQEYWYEVRVVEDDDLVDQGVIRARSLADAQAYVDDVVQQCHEHMVPVALQLSLFPVEWAESYKVPGVIEAKKSAKGANHRQEQWDAEFTEDLRDRAFENFIEDTELFESEVETWSGPYTMGRVKWTTVFLQDEDNPDGDTIPVTYVVVFKKHSAEMEREEVRGGYASEYRPDFKDLTE